MDIVATLEFRPFSIVSLITFHFGEQIFGSGKASKQAYSVLYNCFGNEARGKKMPSKWKVIDDTMLSRPLKYFFKMLSGSDFPSDYIFKQYIFRSSIGFYIGGGGIKQPLPLTKTKRQ